jgi:hypothetical protein
MEVKTDKIRSVARFLSFNISLALYQSSMRTPQRSAFLPLFPMSCENHGFKDKAGSIRMQKLEPQSEALTKPKNGTLERKAIASEEGTLSLIRLIPVAASAV